jgi:hypothetical protein
MRHAMAGLAGSAVVALAATGAQAGMDDLSQWTLVQDPEHELFTTEDPTAAQAKLFAGNGSIPSGTDIGYQSIEGQTAATSTSGFAFDPAFSFSVAIDFSVTFTSPSGQLGIGFGIGEDRDGQDSAGAALLLNNGTPSLSFGAAARINDVSQSPQVIHVFGSSTGSLFATYDAATGNVILGAGATGATNPAGTTTFGGIQNQWDDEQLLVSFFLRSDNSLGNSAWQSGTAQATFSNFRVRSGTPLAIPEPATAATAAPVFLALLQRRRRPR